MAQWSRARVAGRLKVGSDDDLVRLNDAAWRVLERTGFKVHSTRLLQKLAEMGACVDDGTMIATFPRALLDERLGCGLLPEPSEEAIAVAQDYRVSLGEVCFFLYDWETGERRRATRQDTVDMIRLGDAIPEVRTISTPVVNSEIDQRLEVLEAIELLVANSNKGGGTGIRCPEQVRHIVEITRMCEKHGDPRRFVQTAGCLTTPLTLGERTAQIIEQLMDFGYDTFAFSSMPIAGGNAPVTTAGCAVMTIAELLGGRLVARAVNPEAKGVGSIITGTMDMTNGRPSFCSPQAMLQDILVWRVFRRLYGITIGVERKASYINAKVPGLQAAYERTFKQMTLADATGGLGMHLGSLDGAAIFSPEQAMIDLDLCRGLWKFYRGVDMSDEALAVDEIESIGAGDGKSTFDTDHTLRHFRDSLWMPKLLDVSMWHDGLEADRERTMLRKANAQWKEYLGSWRQPEVNPELVADIHGVVERARAELAG